MEVDFMRIAQDEHMFDEGKRLKLSITQDTYGQPVRSYSDGTATKCGFEMLSGSERDKEKMTVAQYDAIVRIPIGYEIEPEDKFQITKINGESVSIDFEVAAPLQRGRTCNRILLRMVKP